MKKREFACERLSVCVRERERDCVCTCGKETVRKRGQEAVRKREIKETTRERKSKRERL